MSVGLTILRYILTYILFLFEGIYYVTMTVIFPIYSSKRGLSTSTTSTIIGLNEFGKFLSFFIISFLVIPKNLKFTYCLSGIISGVGMALFGLAYMIEDNSIYLGVIITNRIISGISAGIVEATCLPLNMELFPQFTAWSYNAADMFCIIGIVCGGMFLSSILHLMNFYTPFIIISILAVILCVIVYIALPNNFQNDSRPSKLTFHLPFMSFSLMMIVLPSLTFEMSGALYDATFSIFLSSNFSLSEEFISLFYSICFVFGLIFSYLLAFFYKFGFAGWLNYFTFIAICCCFYCISFVHIIPEYSLVITLSMLFTYSAIIAPVPFGSTVIICEHICVKYFLRTPEDINAIKLFCASWCVFIRALGRIIGYFVIGNTILAYNGKDFLKTYRQMSLFIICLGSLSTYSFIKCKLFGKVKLFCMYTMDNNQSK